MTRRLSSVFSTLMMLIPTAGFFHARELHAQDGSPCGGSCEQNGFWQNGNTWQASWYCNDGYFNCEGSGSFTENSWNTTTTCTCENG